MLVDDREGDIEGDVWMVVTTFPLSVLAFVKKCCHSLQVSLEMTRPVVAKMNNHGPMEQKGKVVELS